MRINTIFKSRVTICVFLFGILGACASPAQLEQMVVSDPELSNAAANTVFHNAIGIESIDGGEETNPLWTSEVGNTEFSGALRQSLEDTQLLSRDTAPQYLLKATLKELDQPLFGFDLTVTSTVTYHLREAKTQKVYFDDTVIEAYTATMGDAFVAIKRLRLANEGSIRENISTFIEELLKRQEPIN